MGTYVKKYKIAKNLLKGIPTSMGVPFNDGKFNLDIHN